MVGSAPARSSTLTLEMAARMVATCNADHRLTWTQHTRTQESHQVTARAVHYRQTLPYVFDRIDLGAFFDQELEDVDVVLRRRPVEPTPSVLL